LSLGINSFKGSLITALVLVTFGQVPSTNKVCFTDSSRTKGKTGADRHRSLTGEVNSEECHLCYEDKESLSHLLPNTNVLATHVVEARKFQHLPLNRVRHFITLMFFLFVGLVLPHGDNRQTLTIVSLITPACFYFLGYTEVSKLPSLN
jgi:hypothetical protein